MSISDDKHKQQLKELEEAMKSTWEEKAKISQDYEKDRLRMIQEQKNAAKQLQTAKERNWKLLEDKGDLDLSINHVKGISKKFFAIASALDHWYKALAEITGKTQELTELDTVTQVYRSSIEKDSSALIKVFPHVLLSALSFSIPNFLQLSML